MNNIYLSVVWSRSDCDDRDCSPKHSRRKCMLYLKTSYTSASICTNEVVISCSKFLYEHGSGIQNGALI